MRVLGAIVVGLTLAVSPALADELQQRGQQQQQPQHQQQDRQGQQTGQPGLGQEQQAGQLGQQQQIRELQIDGRVERVGQEQITLNVAGEEITLQAERQHLQGLSEGDMVRATAVPVPEVEEVMPAPGAQPGQQQQQQPGLQQEQRGQQNPGQQQAAADRDKADKMVTGRVQSVEQDRVTIITEDQQQRFVRVDQQQADQLQAGQEYQFQLTQIPAQAEQWRLTNIERI
jgi:hypothetical protein